MTKSPSVKWGFVDGWTDGRKNGDIEALADAMRALNKMIVQIPRCPHFSGTQCTYIT